MRAAKKIVIPHLLVEAVQNGRAVMVLGAGASKECVLPDGTKPPNGDELRDHLAKRFLNTENETRNLATIAEMAILNGAGEPQVFDEIAKLFKPFKTSPAHIKLAEFKWRGLATTNYDRFIEDGYAHNSARLQSCVPFVKNDEPYEDRLKQEKNSVALQKLHGCLDHRLDREIPLVLSNEHYEFYQKGRDLLFNRLRDWASSSVLIFVGYSLSDAHIKSLIYRIDPHRRPTWYIVSPSLDEHDVRFWSRKSVDVISATFGDFLDELDKMPKLFRSLAPIELSATQPYMKHFRGNLPSTEVTQALARDLTYIHATMSFDEVSPEKFYSGFDSGWCGIIRNFDFPRKVGEDLLYLAADDTVVKDDIRFYLLEGAAGAGKTIALKRAAFNAAFALDQMVFWLNDDGVPRAEIFEEIYGLTGLRPMLFIDHISMHAEQVERLLLGLKRRNIPITIIASEREAEWESYCGNIEKSFPISRSTLRKLSKFEAENLVDLLERHGCLGQLSTVPKSERIDAFLGEERADRHLLVALHELTQGKPFEEIILNEYERIPSVQARELYLDIATMHQFGVTARSGAISRISGIRFSDFKEEFLSPLREIVRVSEDQYTGDQGYETRHSHVADIVFRVVCLSDAERSKQLGRIIGGLDSGYSSDQHVLKSICKGRKIAATFSNVEAGREIFRAATEAMPTAAYLFQQAAIYEMQHSKGSLDVAEEFALTARAIDEDNHIYLHTLAEVSRRKANSVTSPVRAEQLRSQARRYLNSIHGTNSFKSLTFCNLVIDEAIAYLRSLPEAAKDHQILEFDKKVEEAKDRLDKARKDHPTEAEFPATEGRLWKNLGDDLNAKRVLQQAIALRTNSSGVFLRLANLQLKSIDSLPDAIKTLESGLQKFPVDKQLHLQMAIALIERDRNPSSTINGHFLSSYSFGDNSLDARFYHACYLFWSGKIDESRNLFEDIERKSQDGYRSRVGMDENLFDQFIGDQTGNAVRPNGDYFFIQSGCYSKPIYAHASSLRDCDLDDLAHGTPLKFKVSFNRRGPVASVVSRR